MAAEVSYDRKRSHSSELCHGDLVRTKKPRLNDIHEAYLGPYGVWSSPEQTLSLLRRDMESLMFQEIFDDFDWAIQDSLMSDSGPDSPSSPSFESGDEGWMSDSFLTVQQPTITVPPPTNVSPIYPVVDKAEHEQHNEWINVETFTDIKPPTYPSMPLTAPTMQPHAPKNNKPPKTKLKPQKRRLDEDSDSYSSSPPPQPQNESSKKRSRLPPNSVAIFRHWLFNHLESPYPSEEEKEELASKAGLRITQVNNWFTNARRRILPREDLEAHGRARSLANELF
jgi:hypothetical protein